MEEQPTLQRMVIQEVRTRPDPNDPNQRVAIVCAYGTDARQYKFEVTMPKVVVDQIHPGNYVTATLNSDQTICAFVWAFKATDNRNAVLPDLRQVTIHDTRVNLPTGARTDSKTYFVQVCGETTEWKPYIVEFEAAEWAVRHVMNRNDITLLVDPDNIARKIVIGHTIIDVTHVGKP